MVVCGGAFAGEGGWHFCGVNVVVGGGVWIGDLLFSLLSFVLFFFDRAVELAVCVEVPL